MEEEEKKLNQETNMNPRCRCGELLRLHAVYRQHAVEYVTAPDYPEELTQLYKKENWDEDASEEHPNFSWDDPFKTFPTNSYGTIRFGGNDGNSNPAEYIRVCDEDTATSVWGFMKEIWTFDQPNKPNVVVSILGGAKNFRLQGDARQKFDDGLLKIAENTHTWFITSGFNIGVTKAVGQIGRDGQTYEEDRVQCLGIAPWGLVQEREMLEPTWISEHLGSEKEYRTSKCDLGSFKPIPLNPHHTHFVLYDNGYRNLYRNRYKDSDRMATYKAKLQQQISIDFPTVLVVAEGGRSVFSDIIYSLESEMPVVICKGTGRAADILANAVTMFDGQQQIDDTRKRTLKEELGKVYGEQQKEKPEEQKEMENLIEAIEKYQKHINIFDVGQDQGLDYVVLSAICKCPAFKSKWDLMEVAISWNRPDVAKHELFRETAAESVKVQDKHLESVLNQGLDKFVRLFLRQDEMDLGTFLTKGRLLGLYKKSMEKEDTLLCQLLQRKAKFNVPEKLTLEEVWKVLKLLLHGCCHNKNTVYCTGPKDDTVTDPNLQLFIWAVLSEQENMALVFWERVEAPIATAMLGCWMVNSMIKQTQIASEELKKSLMETKRRMEHLAAESLTRLDESYPEQARDCIVADHPFWNDVTCLSMAVEAEAMTFVSVGPCQKQLWQEWIGDVRMSNYRVKLSLPLAVLLPCFIDTWGKLHSEKRHNKEKLKSFYTSPIIKFTCYVMTYLAFLMMFTYLILFDLQENASTLEKVCFVWTLSILMDELHRFICVPAVSFCSRVFLWRGLFYLAYIFSLAMVGVGFFLHTWTIRLRVVRVIYSFNCVLFYIRILHFYTASEILGPMLHIIKSTLKSLFYFGMIGIVFLCAYGIPAQALMYERRQPYWGVAYDISYLPYWHIYGELQLENMESDETCTSSYNLTSTDEVTPCRKASWVVPFLLGVYLFFANVLLLNLIIAKFTRIFETVERDSIKIWKYEMYFFIKEYSSKSVLPLPLSLIEDCVRIIYIIYAHISNDRWSKCSVEQTSLDQSTKRHMRWVERQAATRTMREKARMEPAP